MPSIPVAVAASLVLTIHPRMPFTLIAGLFVLPVTQMDPSAAAPRLPRTSYAPSIREPLPSRPTSVRWRGRRCPRARSRIARGFREWLTASPVQKALAQILSCCTTTYYQRGIPEIQLGTYPYLSRKSAKKQRFFSTANARFYYATSYNIKRYLDPIATHSPFPGVGHGRPVYCAKRSANGSRTHDATMNRSLRVRLPVPRTSLQTP